MFVFIMTENGLPCYCIVIESINKSVNSVLSHKSSSTSLETSLNMVFHATSRLCGAKFYSTIASFSELILLMLKQQCIRVWLCKPVQCANKCSYRY